MCVYVCVGENETAEWVLNEKGQEGTNPLNYNSVVCYVLNHTCSTLVFCNSRAPSGAVTHSLLLKPSETAHCDVASSDSWVFIERWKHTHVHKSLRKLQQMNNTTGYNSGVNQLCLGSYGHCDPSRYLTWTSSSGLRGSDITSTGKPPQNSSALPSKQACEISVNKKTDTDKHTNKDTYFHCVVYKHRHAWTGHTTNTPTRTQDLSHTRFFRG